MSFFRTDENLLDAASSSSSSVLPSWLNGNAGSVTLVFIRNDLLLT